MAEVVGLAGALGAGAVQPGREALGVLELGNRDGVGRSPNSKMGQGSGWGESETAEG